MQSENTMKLSLRPREAAAAIGISARTLWTLTKRGEIPHTRLGRTVLYPVEALRRWLQERSQSRTADTEAVSPETCQAADNTGYCQSLSDVTEERQVH